MSCRRVLFTVVFLTGLLYMPHASADHGPVYSFAVVPQQSAGELAEVWSPLLARLSERSGLNLHFATAPDISTFYRRLEQGEYDFAYMNPYQYAVFHRRPGYVAFAREQGRRLQGIVVVRRDAAFKSVKDLDGMTLAFPSPSAFAASILPQAELRRQGVAYSPRYVASHDSVYLGVAKGLFPAGGGLPRTLEMLDAKVREQLRVLFTTASYTPHAFAYHPRVDPSLVTRLRAAMLALDQQKGGPDLLAKLGFQGIEAGNDDDWDEVRALAIDDATLNVP